MTHREKGKFTDRETVQLLDALKRNMTPSDKVTGQLFVENDQNIIDLIFCFKSL